MSLSHTMPGLNFSDEINLGYLLENDAIEKKCDALLEQTDRHIETLLNHATSENATLEYKFLSKLVSSRSKILNAKRPLKVAVVFAMWGEHNRLRSASEQNPNGENSLNLKLNQLSWLFQGTDFEWTLYACDDGCPHKSGEIAQHVTQDNPNRSHLRVLHLADAIEKNDPIISSISCVDDSKKGGAIRYSADQALKDGADVVITTDADVSVHLGQIGLLIDEAISKEKPVAFGDRKAPTSVLVKQENRWGDGISLLRHIQRRVGSSIFSHGVNDTQAAFKLYDAQALTTILASTHNCDFSFDTEWLAASIHLGLPFSTVAFAFVDSADESASIAQGPMGTWLALIHGITAQMRQFDLPHDANMAKVVEQHLRTIEDLEAIIDICPPQLKGVNNARLGHPKIMDAVHVRNWINAQKNISNAAMASTKKSAADEATA